MATGDSNDLTARAQRIVPPRWFASDAVYAPAIMGGISDALAWIYGFIQYAYAQLRVSTSSGVFVDLWSLDWLAQTLPRRPSEPDTSFIARILKEVVRTRVTRPGMAQALTDLTAQAPVIIEPWNPGDCGAWSSTTTGVLFNRWGWSVGNTSQTSSVSPSTPFAYGNTATWGSTAYPDQALIAYWPPGFYGAASVGGWSTGVGSGGTQNGFGWATGTGSGATVYGISEWVSMSTLGGPVSTQDILNTINRTKPVGVTVWTAAV